MTDIVLILLKPLYANITDHVNIDTTDSLILGLQLHFSVTKQKATRTITFKVDSGLIKSSLKHVAIYRRPMLQRSREELSESTETFVKQFNPIKIDSTIICDLTPSSKYLN